MNKPYAIRKIIDLSLIMAFTIGLCAFVLSFLPQALSGFGLHFHTTEFPMGYPGWIFVDSKGQIYCYSRPYGRLQVYDKAGKFIGGSFTGIGLIPVSKPSEETLHVVTVADWHVIYDSTGKEIKKWREKEVYEKLSGMYGNRSGCEDIAGNKFTFYNPILLTEIVKTNPEGKKTVLIKEPIYFFPIRSPFPAILLVGIPVVVWVARYALKKKRVKQ